MSHFEKLEKHSSSYGRVFVFEVERRGIQSWYAVRSVLIASVVGLAINIIITVWATVTGWLNGRAWGSTAVLVLLLVGAAYQLVVRRLEDR